MSFSAQNIQSEVYEQLSNLSVEDRKFLFENFEIIRELLQNGVDGTFTTSDPYTVTVTKGIITGIV